MQTFLSTLAQLSATILAILLTAIIAYFVFLQDRSAQFRDGIDEAKFAIKDALIDLRTRWPWTLTMYMPPEFNEKYRSKYATKSHTDLIYQAAADLVFNNREMAETLLELRDQAQQRGPFPGRIYFWILTEAVTEITVGSPDAHTKPEGVFPSSVQGPGFEQWRSDFEKLQGTFQLLSDFQKNMTDDFKQYIAELPSDSSKEMFTKLYVNAVVDFFNKIEIVKAKLNELNKLELLMKAYSFSDRIHLWSLFILLGLTTILGIILPLILLALPKEITSTVGIVLLFTALISIGGSFSQFVYDVSRPLSFDRKAYISTRWYSFLLKEMERQRPKLENGGLLDVEFFVNALNSDDKKHFSHEAIRALEEYINCANFYNDRARDFNSIFLEAIRKDKQLGTLVSNHKSLKGGPVLYPYYVLLDEDKWRSHLDGFLRSLQGGDMDISIEVLMPRWTRVEFKIPGRAFSASPTKLTESLTAIRAVVNNAESAKQFLQARTELQTCTKRLQEVMNRENK